MTVQEKHCPGCCAKGETLPAEEFDKEKETAIDLLKKGQLIMSIGPYVNEFCEVLNG